MKDFFKLFLFQSFLFILSKNKVIFVFEHFRHGARSPSTLNDKDLDSNNETWNGLQELSNLGLRQHYLLGNYIRNKYPELINYEKYNPKEIEVLSTMTNRTIMSARAQLHGIFNKTKPKGINKNQSETCMPYYLLNEKDQYNLKNVSIYPEDFPEEVPVHIVDYKEKLMQLEKNNYCPKIKEMREENKKRKEIQDFVKKFNETYGERLLNIFNIKNDKNYFADYENINDVCIEFIIDRFDDRELKIYNKLIDLDEFFKISMEFFKLKTTLIYANNKEGTLAYVGSSILLRKILSYIEKFIDDINNNINDSPKLVLLSSHDTAISNMEGLLYNLFNTSVLEPTFAASYIFELEKQDNNNYIINLIFNNNKIKSISYDEFKNKIINSSWTYEKTGEYCGFIKKEENNNRNKNDSNNLWLMITIILSLINSLIIIAIVFLFIKLKSSNSAPELVQSQKN